MDTPRQTDEQSAITLMLASIGERPVNDIDTDQRLDVKKAMVALNEVNVSVQTKGWWLNREDKIELKPNGSGELDLPANVVKIDAWKSSTSKFVQRGRRLYNNETRSFIDNTANLFVNWVVLLPFDDCPETFKLYVARRAGSIFQKRSVGSTTLFEFSQEDVNEAWALLLQEEVDQEDSNLRNAPDQFELNHQR